MSTKIGQFISLLCSTGILTSVVLTLPLVNPLHALAQDEGPSGSTSDPIESAKPSYLDVCNKNSQSGILSVAIATRREGGWLSKGWYHVPFNTCSRISLGYYQGEVMYYAKSSSRQEWTSSNTFCVNPNSRFEIPYSQANSRDTCGKTLQGVGMRSIGKSRLLNF